MCGICGYVSRQSIRVDELTEMNNTMIHRGPDCRRVCRPEHTVQSAD